MYLCSGALNRFSRSSSRRCSVKKRGSWKSRKFHRNTTVLESLLINLETSSLMKKILQYSYFAVKFAKASRTPIFKCICKRLLLIFRIQHILFLPCLVNFIRFNINRIQSWYFFNCNNLIWSNGVISIMFKLKNVSLTFQSTFLLNSY